MENIAVFPGSFDPITRGHESIIRRALPLFDKVIVAIGENGEKKSFFQLERRLAWLHLIFSQEPRIAIVSYTGMTIDFCRRENARFILRGLRTSADFEFERSVAQVNLKLVPEIETVFLLTLPEYVMVTSSIVREVHRHGGNIDQFIPEQISI